MLSYLQAFKDDDGSCFVYVRDMSIVDNMTSSYFLAANRREAYIRNIVVWEMIIEHEGALSLHFRKCKDASVLKNLGITHFDDLVRYISFATIILLIVQAAILLPRYNCRLPSSMLEPFWRARVPRNAFHVYHMEQGVESFSTFALFHWNKVQEPKTISHLIIIHIRSSLYPFDHDAKNRSNKWDTKQRG